MIKKIIKKPLVLVDCSSYFYRAYYAFPSLMNSAGEPTGAIYGVLNMLKSLLAQYKPSHAAIIFDSTEKTFRYKLFEFYKFNRKPMPKNMRNQITPLYSIIKAMGLPLLVINDFEADDIIGTLALIAVHDGYDVLISTNDKDMTQLVSPKITLLNTMTNIVFGPEEVKLKFGVPPELIVDYLALMGDTSDNIPGIPGIGKKTAVALLKGIGGLRILYQRLDEICYLQFKGAKTTATKLQQYRNQAFLSYKLAKIKTDVKLDFSYDNLEIIEPNVEALVSFFERYEFKHFLENLEIFKMAS